MKSKEELANEYLVSMRYKLYSENEDDIAYNGYMAGLDSAEQWISVNDELPDKKEKKKVLVMLDNNDWDTDTYIGYWFTFGDSVKFWRPLRRK